MTLLPNQTIVVPIDFSEDSARAVQVALEMADRPASVRLVHVLVPLDAVSPGVVWGQVDDSRRSQAVREHCQKFLSERGISGPSLEIKFGDPGLEIAEYAQEAAADLIIMPSHGYHGVKRLLLGSVTERVIRHAHCSVLVLRRSDADR
jgi:nucleotide-binding universal stress UspA family protein